MGTRTIWMCDICHKEEGEPMADGSRLRTADRRFKTLSFIFREATVCSLACAIAFVATQWFESVRLGVNDGTTTSEVVAKLCQCNVEGRHGHTAGRCPKRAAFMDTKTNLAVCGECSKLSNIFVA